MNQIKYVYFDVGGVLLLDFSGTNKWVELKRDLGFTESQDELFDNIWKKYKNRTCIDCDVDIIIADFEIALGKKLENYSLLEDFVNRFELNQSMWPVVKAAKKRFPVGLLTNMYPRMLQTINSKKLLPDVEWDTSIDSSEVGYQKPEAGIFDVAEKTAGVEPESIFFIDNSAKHVVEAKKRGWQTLLYNPQEIEESNQEIIKILELATELRQ